MRTKQSIKTFEIFAGGSRLLAAKKAGLEQIPVVVFEGYSDDEIVAEADRDNKEDEFHKPLSILDIWRYYYELSQRPPDDKGKWTQPRIAEAVGENQARVSERINWHINLPDEIKKFIQQGNLTEGHLRQITKIFIVEYFSPWITTEQLWIDIAKWVVEKGKSTSETEREVLRWKAILESAKEIYNSVPSQEQIGEDIYYPQGIP